MSAKTTEKTSAKGGFKSERRRHDALTVIFSILSFIYLIPIFLVAMNSFKSNASINLETFAFPREGTFVALDNYIKGLTFGNYPFLKSAGYSLLITIVSAALILLCTSMAAWYIARVGSGFSKLVYYLCVFSMVVPFQMVMFTLARTADTLKLNTPYTYFNVVLPMLKPTMISVGVLEIMWVWNDYLLPYLVLDRKQYMTIPIHIQFLQGSYGSVDLGAVMALIMLSIIPVIIFYLTCQKHIIKGVAAGAVKG